jgi:hypothetical protein
MSKLILINANKRTKAFDCLREAGISSRVILGGIEVSDARASDACSVLDKECIIHVINE